MERIVGTADVCYSALVQYPPAGMAVRGLLVCVHGGGMTSGYFDSPVDRSLSVMRTLASAGYVVLAPDRPGYGDTPASAGLDFDGQAGWLAACLRSFVDEFGHDELGTGLIGHSMGSMVALALAAQNPADFFALSLSGITARYLPERVPDVDPESATDRPRLSAGLWWGAPSLYPAGAFSQARLPTSPVSDDDRAVASQWPDLVGGFAGRCRVPTQIVLGDQDQWWVGGEEGLAEMAGLFTSAPWLDVHEQRQAAHNFGLGWAARPYAMRVLAFVEDALVDRRTGASG